MNDFIKRHVAKIGFTLITLIIILIIYFNQLKLINNYIEIFLILITTFIFILGILWGHFNKISKFFESNNYYTLLFYSILLIIGIIFFSYIVYFIIYSVFYAFNFSNINIPLEVNRSKFLYLLK